VDEDYTNNLIQQHSGQENPFGDALNRALDYLYTNKPEVPRQIKPDSGPREEPRSG
jgi:hypothetical protein